MKFSPLLEKLINDLQIMPGIGPRSAQRIAFHILDHHRDNALKLSSTIRDAVESIHYCKCCRSYCESDICEICSDSRRKDYGVLCVVETPADVLAIENTNEFKGTYFVLHGHLSPLDGIGPSELKLEELEVLFQNNKYNEVILATNPTVEGDATAHFVAHIAKKYNINATRIARGVPIGSEVDSIDGSTLTRSLNGRSPF
ncbi:MAG: recombination mediator RecR [Succinivibrionaceae bacterium]